MPRDAQQRNKPVPASRGPVQPNVVEALEGRRLFAFATLAGNVLTISGTAGNDTISFGLDSSNTTVYDATLNGVTEQFPATGTTAVKSVQIFGDGNPGGDQDTIPGGNDFISVNSSLPGAGGQIGVAVAGGPGNDTIFGSVGADVVEGDSGNDSIFGNDGSDTLTGNDGNDTIRGGAGNDILGGVSGDDQLVGGLGNDTVEGGDGNDVIRGAKGDDQVNGNDGNDLVIGGPGNDNCDGGLNADTVIGGTGNDTMTGGLGADVLAGDNELSLIPSGDFAADSTPGNDNLAGGALNDTLISGGGSDTVNGVANNDLFEIYNGVTVGSTDFNTTDDTLTSQRVYTGPAAVTKTADVTLKVNEDGTLKNVPIPSTAGVFSGGTSIARVTGAAADGQGAQVTFSSNNASQTFTLGDFLAQWGIDFSSTGIGRYTNQNAGSTPLAVTVNGVANNQFGSYVIQNGDKIVITATYHNLT